MYLALRSQASDRNVKTKPLARLAAKQKDLVRFLGHRSLRAHFVRDHSDTSCSIRRTEDPSYRQSLPEGHLGNPSIALYQEMSALAGLSAN